MTEHNLILGGMLIIMLAAGCSDGQPPFSPEDTALESACGSSPQPAFSSPQISSAHLNVYVGFPNGQSVNLHGIISDWDSASITWNSFGAAFSPDIEASFVVDLKKWYEVDVTTLVQSWVTGEQGNFGILLEQSLPAAVPAMLHSKEKTGFEPFLEICHIAPLNSACDTILPLADVFIDEALPDAVIGASTVLLVGQTMIPGMEKQALIRFDLTGVFPEPGSSVVGGYMWEDADEDGLRDTSEPGIPKAEIRLYDCQKSLLASVLTDSAGSYRFDGLPGGDFLIEFVVPEGFLFSPANQSDDDTIDSDADPETGLTECFAVGDGEVMLIWCAGVHRPTEGDSPCTHSKGYWRHRAGFGPEANEVSLHLPIWLGRAGGVKSLLVDNSLTAVQVLSGKNGRSASNGIAKLYAQFLATKLNIACGTSDLDVADVIAYADDFLTDHDCTAWKTLGKDDRKTVLGWMGTLDDYNNGVIGPGHCDDDQRGVRIEAR